MPMGAWYLLDTSKAYRLGHYEQGTMYSTPPAFMVISPLDRVHATTLRACFLADGHFPTRVHMPTVPRQRFPPSPHDLRSTKNLLGLPAPATVLLEPLLEQCAAVIAGFDSSLVELPQVQ